MTTEELGLDFVSHHGVKGMRWGVRREAMRTSGLAKRGAKEAQRREMRVASPVRVTDTIGKTSFTKTKLKAVGGEDHPAHPDAITVAASRQKLKKSGIHTLSNDELQKMSTRMNLESQVHSLNARRPKSVGQGFVDAHLAKAQKDPLGTAMKAHKIAKNVKRSAKIASVAAALA
jgi:hypothetical protein